MGTGTAQGERERDWLRPPARGGRSLNSARRQQYRRLFHVGTAGLGSIIAALFGVVTASTGAVALAGLLLRAAIGLGLYARHWLRSLVAVESAPSRSTKPGARSPSPGGGVAASALAAVARPGRHDSVAIAPTGIAVAIERLISGVRDVMASVRSGFAWRARHPNEEHGIWPLGAAPPASDPCIGWD
jgi:hypothetical protein